MKKVEDKVLWETVRADFVKASQKHGLDWSEDYLDTMTNDLCRAILDGKVLPPTIKYLKD